MKKNLKSFIPTKRRLMQLYFGLLLNANLKGFISGRIYTGDSKIVCAPGINCYSCPGAVGACPLGSLQGTFSKNHSAVFYVVGILLLYALMFGRMICGWLCPFGLVQDLLHKVPTPKVKKSPVTRLLSLLKYAILVLFVFIVPIAYGLRHEPLPAFCKYICPAGTLEGGMTLTSNWMVQNSYLPMLGYLFTWKFLLMVSILVGCIFVFRLFCRFLCPLGALYGLFNKISFFGVKVDEDKCTNCGLCVQHCKVDIRHVGDRECISCGECVNVCPTKAITWKGPKIFLQPPQTSVKPSKKQWVTRDRYRYLRKSNSVKPGKKQWIVRSVVAVVMLAILGGAIYYFWQDTPPLSSYEQLGVTKEYQPVKIETGNEIGNRAPAFELTTQGNTIDPIKTDKITLVMFLAEDTDLNALERIAEDFADEAAVIAIHSGEMEVPTDSTVIFATDAENQYYTLLGGTGTYPYTVTLDDRGIITGIFTEALSYDDMVESITGSRPVLPPEGTQPGDLCPSYNVEIVTASGASGETIDPAKTGKITIVNFWGTWCGPCVEELPDFNKFAADYEGEVTVVAIHSGMIRETAPDFIKTNYADSNMIFGWDVESDESGVYYSKLGGSGAFPYTLILDDRGVIVKTYTSKVHYADLQAVVEGLL